MALELTNQYIKEYFYSEEGALDAHLFHEGTFYKSYHFLGAHPYKEGSVRFVVWAPHAQSVYVMGDFNEWDATSLPMEKIKGSGLWEICIYGVAQEDHYKYRMITPTGEESIKADPYGFYAEVRPRTASKYYDLAGYEWRDTKWLTSKKKKVTYDEPVAIYEVNLMSWRQKEDGSPYSYKELAIELVSYVKKMGFTHIELMPIMEHPFDGSWGYQTTGYFAPTSRFGTPKDFMYFVDKCHEKGIGVILDWAPAHFCKDAHGLRLFDGTSCFESNLQVLAENNQWGTSNFDFSKKEVESFLISNALYWHEYYHIDGLRIDAVAYMLYLNFSGKDIVNEQGTYENTQAVSFLKKLNQVVFKEYPSSLMIAEESTTWPMVTKPTHDGGLGFNYKWNMGWMNDILEYMGQDPLFRAGNQKALTFSITYAFSENFVLALSHDEVVHGKKSLLDKMPGTYDQKFAQLRLLYLYMYTHPGKKLLFMGGEFGQFIEWDEWKELDWFLLAYEKHHKMQSFVTDLNHLYKKSPALYDQDTSYDGFLWIEHTNHQESIIAFERISKNGDRVIAIFNFTPIPRNHYPIGVWKLGTYKTLFHTDKARYGGELKRVKRIRATNMPIHDRPYCIRVDLPPLGGILLTCD
jgi:1,4-alpha-glucan branching enzyme